jgi:2,3-bisphosphoglycerate-independent phosphoglycerate mutase
MRDFTAGHVSSAEAAELLDAAQKELGDERLEFLPGVSYRNLLMVRGRGGPAPFAAETRSTPPHDLTDKSVADDFPRGQGSDLLCDLMSRSQALFADHPVNVARRREGKLPVTNIWLWGLGKTPRLQPFAEVYGKSGKMITAVDLLRGLAALIGWERIEVPGATGYTDTDYAAKGRAAVEALGTTDIVCVHVEATDEASHEGDTAAKVLALEEIDRWIARPLLDALRKEDQWRILVSPDHPTPLRIKTHSHGYVPLAMAGSGVTADEQKAYDEDAAQKSELVFDEGWRLMRSFLEPCL